MKIGVFTVLFSQRPFEEALDYIKAAGCEAVEIGVGGYPGPAHAVAAAWHAAWLSGSDEVDPCSAWAEPVRRNRKKERVRT